MSDYVDFLLVGGGIASASAAETLRKSGAALPIDETWTAR